MPPHPTHSHRSIRSMNRCQLKTLIFAFVCLGASTSWPAATMAEVITVLNTGSAAAPGQASVTFPFNAGATADKIIVQVSSEFSGLTAVAVNYNGVPLTLIPGTALGRNRGLWYLDSPYTGGSASLTATINASVVNGMGVGVLSISGSVAGYAGSSAVASNSISVAVAEENSLVVAGFAENTHGPTASALTPLTQIYGNVGIGSANGAAGYANGVTAGTHAYSFSGVDTTTDVTSAAWFTPVPEPSSGALLGAAVLICVTSAGLPRHRRVIPTSPK